MNRLSQEVLDRENDWVTLFDYAVSEPLERCAERFMRRMDVEFERLQSGASLDTPRNSSGSSHNSSTSSSTSEKDLDHHSQSQECVVSNAKEQPSTAITHARSRTSQNDNSRASSLLSLSSQISDLSKKILEHLHITTPSIRQKHLDSLHQIIESELSSKLQTEKTKAIKREYAIFQKFESMAGLMARRYLEENAKRVAQLKTLESKILEAGGWDEKRTSRFMEEVKEIRLALELERKQRVENDERVLKNIVDCRVKLHKALLESMNLEEEE